VLAALIAAWLVLRIILHWLPEILLAALLVYGWTWLMFATPLRRALTRRFQPGGRRERTTKPRAVIMAFLGALLSA
jgi:hypothetical protein